MVSRTLPGYCSRVAETMKERCTLHAVCICRARRHRSIIDDAFVVARRRVAIALLDVPNDFQRLNFLYSPSYHTSLSKCPLGFRL